MNYKKTILIMHPVSSAQYLCDRLNELGFLTIVVMLHTANKSLKNIEKQLVLEGNIKADLRIIQQDILQSYNVYSFIISDEHIVPYFEKISSIIFPNIGNNFKSSNLRCDKNEMNIKMMSDGYLSIKQKSIKEDNLINLPKLLDTFGYPCVVKPKLGCGSIGVQIIRSERDANNYKNHVKDINKHEYITRFQQEFLIQEYLEGDEYFIDTCSVNNRHRIVGIHKYTKYKNYDYPIYQSSELVDPNSKEGIICQKFSFDVLSNLEFSHGMAHIEIMLTSKGPILIELNPRISGSQGFSNKLTKVGYGLDQIDIFIEMLEDIEYPDRKFLDLNLIKNGKVYYLQNFNFKYNKILYRKFESLNSYQEHITLIKSNKDACYPSNLSDTVCFILFSNHNRQQLDEDINKLSYLEKSGELFDWVE